VPKVADELPVFVRAERLTDVVVDTDAETVVDVVAGERLTDAVVVFEEVEGGDCVDDTLTVRDKLSVAVAATQGLNTPTTARIV